MKRIIIVFLALVLVVPLFAQGGEKDEGFKRGYRGIVEIGYLKGLTEFNTTENIYYYKNVLKLHLINGYKINPYFVSGIGVGLHYYPISYSSGGDKWFFPIFAYFRGNLNYKHFSPYLSIGSGTSIFDGGESGITASYYINPKVGISYSISNNMSVDIDLGYDVEAGYWYYYHIRLSPNHAISLNVGLSF